MPLSIARTWLVALVCLLGAGCVEHVVRVIDMTPPEQMDRTQTEDELLDVGVAIFDPNVPESYDEQVKQLIQPDIRRAEANFIPYMAKNVLQSTGNWGAVRVVPRPTHAVDVIVDGKILHSTGENLTVEMTVTDARGARWFSKEYDALASKYSYDEKILGTIDPFQSIYKQLSDDMLEYRKSLSAEDVVTIRRTAEMTFAQDFAPDAFSDHVIRDKDGEYLVMRLPAEDDPMLERVRRVREREYLFIDTLDEYYESYQRDMYSSYQNWRRATYNEAIAYKQLRAQARARAIAGTTAIIAGGAAMAASSDPYVESSGLLSVIGGVLTIKSAIAKRAEAEIHAEVLQEVGIAAEAEIMPHTIELENQTVRLQGTVEEQYQELRGILRTIYFEDIGLPVPEDQPEPS
jgi:hypothetical protein